MSLAVWTDLIAPMGTLTGVEGNVSPFAHALPRLYERGAFRSSVPRIIQGTTVGAARYEQDESIDIFVDDAGHQVKAQVDTFKAWFPKMRRNGSYIVEDVLKMNELTRKLRAQAKALAGAAPGLLPENAEGKAGKLYFCHFGYRHIVLVRTQPIPECEEWCVSRSAGAYGDVTASEYTPCRRDGAPGCGKTAWWNC